MSKFENVLKAQKVRHQHHRRHDQTAAPFFCFVVVVSLPFVRSFVRKERDRNARGSLFRGPFFISFSPKNDLISSSSSLSFVGVLSATRQPTVLPAAAQTRALER